MSFYDPSPLGGLRSIVPKAVVKQQQKQTISRVEDFFQKVQHDLGPGNLGQISPENHKVLRDIPLSREKADFPLPMPLPEDVEKRKEKK